MTIYKHDELFYMCNKLDESVKNPKNVIPAQAGICKFLKSLDSPIKSENDKKAGI